MVSSAISCAWMTVTLAKNSACTQEPELNLQFIFFDFIVWSGWGFASLHVRGNWQMPLLGSLPWQHGPHALAVEECWNQPSLHTCCDIFQTPFKNDVTFSQPLFLLIVLSKAAKCLGHPPPRQPPASSQCALSWVFPPSKALSVVALWKQSLMHVHQCLVGTCMLVGTTSVQRPKAAWQGPGQVAQQRERWLELGSFSLGVMAQC